MEGVDRLINWAELSRALGSSSGSIRSGRIPKNVEWKVMLLRGFLEMWVRMIGELPVRIEKYDSRGRSFGS